MAKNEEKKNRTNNEMEDFDMDDIFEGTDVPEIDDGSKKEAATDDKDQKTDKKDKKKAKEGVMTKTSNKLNNANAWLERKVRKYPKIACTVFFTIGAVAGVAGKFVYDIVTASKQDEDSIDTDFVQSSTDNDTIVEPND